MNTSLPKKRHPSQANRKCLPSPLVYELQLLLNWNIQLSLQLYIMMMTRISVLIFIFATAFGIINDQYQVRAIYISQADNVCAAGTKSDIVELAMVFDGYNFQNYNVQARTRCYQRGNFYRDKIEPADNWGYSDSATKTEIKIKEETRWVSKAGMLLGIFQKSTVINPTKFEGVLYNCRIYSDGKIQRFGTNHYPSARIFMNCDRVDPKGKEQANNAIEASSLTQEQSE